MRELRSCDFCGGDAAGIFEVLPPEFTPAPDQRRVILCTDCEETLTDVIEPLMSRLEAFDSDAPAATATPETTATPAESASSQADDVGSVEVDAVDPAPEPEEEVAAESPTDDPISELNPSAEEIEVYRDSDSKSESESAGEHDEESHESTEEDHTDVEEAPESAPNGDSMRSEPPKFRQVIRILQNREFPVDRSEVEDLAANAYGLEDDEVRDIFEYAIERGLLEDDGGQLQKT